MKGIDTQRSTHDHAGDLKRDGFGFVARYLNTTPNKTGLSRDEADHLHSQGLKLLSIFELNPTSAGYFSFEKGKSDGLQALALARAAGQPEGGCVFFTVDYDATAHDIDAVLSYFKGVRETLMPAYVPGVYGSGRVCASMWAAGMVRATWLAQSTGWSGFTDWWKDAQVVQAYPETTWHGVDVDFDTCYDASVLW